MMIKTKPFTAYNSSDCGKKKLTARQNLEKINAVAPHKKINI